MFTLTGDVQNPCLKLKIYMKCHNKDMQVKFHNSVLHFDKVIPPF